MVLLKNVLRLIVALCCAVFLFYTLFPAGYVMSLQYTGMTTKAVNTFSEEPMSVVELENGIA